jgi:YD repeat-containing protein
MLTLDVLPRFLQKIPACCIDFGVATTPYLCSDMRSVVLLCGMLSVIFGQAPSLAWVELADTVYGIANAQDTFGVWIQSRSGNVRRFDRYDTTGGSLFLAVYDSVYLDGSRRVQRIRRYGRLNPNDPFGVFLELQFSYPGSPTLKIEGTNGTSPTVLGDLHCYGLTMLEGSVVWDIGLADGAIPTVAYPTFYHTGQVGDSFLVRDFSNDLAFGIARRTRPSACDTFIFYGGPANGPLMPAFGGKICHTNGRIDSIISADGNTYWSYDANGRPIRGLDVSTSSTDTTRYTYDDSGRLIETRQSGVNNNRPYQRRYLLRYRGAPSSLSSALGGDCLFWDAIQRRGALTCQPAGAFTALRLYDLQGRIVWQGSVRGAETFEVPLTLPPGLYYLHTDVGTARLYLMP